MKASVSQATQIPAAARHQPAGPVPSGYPARSRPAVTPQAIDASPRQVTQRQALPNRTGLPDQLKAGVEHLSGHSLDDVRVHYNSARPAALQAHAYAQGTAIHLAPGQQQHLPHEAWHVVQQKQGRVRPTVQLKGTGINDNAGLEQEATRMGQKALGHVAGLPADRASLVPASPGRPATAQLKEVSRPKNVAPEAGWTKVREEGDSIIYDDGMGEEEEAPAAKKQKKTASASSTKKYSGEEAPAAKKPAAKKGRRLPAAASSPAETSDEEEEEAPAAKKPAAKKGRRLPAAASSAAETSDEEEEEAPAAKKAPAGKKTGKAAASSATAAAEQEALRVISWNATMSGKDNGPKKEAALLAEIKEQNAHLVLQQEAMSTEHNVSLLQQLRRQHSKSWELNEESERMFAGAPSVEVARSYATLYRSSVLERMDKPTSPAPPAAAAASRLTTAPAAAAAAASILAAVPTAAAADVRRGSRVRTQAPDRNAGPTGTRRPVYDSYMHTPTGRQIVVANHHNESPGPGGGARPAHERAMKDAKSHMGSGPGILATDTNLTGPERSLKAFPGRVTKGKFDVLAGTPHFNVTNLPINARRWKKPAKGEKAWFGDHRPLAATFGLRSASIASAADAATSDEDALMASEEEDASGAAAAPGGQTVPAASSSLAHVPAASAAALASSVAGATTAAAISEQPADQTKKKRKQKP